MSKAAPESQPHDLASFKNRRPAAERGRRQDRSRDAMIIQATEDLLGEIGYDGLTMSGVASRAGVSKATLYRRWSTKPELVADVINSLGWTDYQRRADDTVRQALIGILEHAGGANGRHQLTSIVLETARTEPELGLVLRSRFSAFLKQEIEAVIQLAKTSGQSQISPKGAAYVVDTAIALLLYLASPADTSMAPRKLAEIVDHVLLPLISGRLAQAK